MCLCAERFLRRTSLCFALRRPHLMPRSLKQCFLTVESLVGRLTPRKQVSAACRYLPFGTSQWSLIIMFRFHVNTPGEVFVPPSEIGCMLTCFCPLVEGPTKFQQEVFLWRALNRRLIVPQLPFIKIINHAEAESETGNKKLNVSDR